MILPIETGGFRELYLGSRLQAADFQPPPVNCRNDLICKSEGGGVKVQELCARLRAYARRFYYREVGLRARLKGGGGGCVKKAHGLYYFCVLLKKIFFITILTFWVLFAD